MSGVCALQIGTGVSVKEGINLILRKLNPEENIRARVLYEEVFQEDDEQFVDYYFNWKTKDNVIYAAENEKGIQATVHLNPFWVYWDGKVQRMNYVVAVATREEYRHQGLMRRLLAMAERDMCEAGEKFTFLMPANEKIYLPFGYRYFAWQRQGILWTGMQCSPCREICRPGILRTGMQCSSCQVICRPVHPCEYALLADFVNEELKKRYSMFIWRDTAYYERLCAEQQCQGGDVMVICREWNCGCQAEGQASGQNVYKNQYEILGTFCTSREEAEEPEQICLAESERFMEQPQRGLSEKIAISSLVLREIVLDTAQFRVAEEALLSYIISVNADTNIDADADTKISVNADESIDTMSGQNIKKYRACRVEGCQRELTLRNEVWKPLLMGKIPGQEDPEKIWEKEAVFINEVV